MTFAAHRLRQRHREGADVGTDIDHRMIGTQELGYAVSINWFADKNCSSADASGANKLIGAARPPSALSWQTDLLGGFRDG
jgi:hypothetical protein